MRASISGLLWKLADPVLLRMRSRLTHFESLIDPSIALASRYSALATFDASVFFLPTAELSNSGRPQDLCIGKYSHIAGALNINCPGATMSIGEYSFIGPQSRIWAATNVTIGNFVLISHLVDIHDNDSHPLGAGIRRQDPIDLFQHKKKTVDFSRVSKSPVTIEDDAWICFKSTILKGVTIGRGAVVAAGAVVTHDVEPYTVVAGNPAKVVKRLDGASVWNPTGA